MIPHRFFAALAATAALLSPLCAHAELAVGARAPDFTTEGALGGKPFSVSLKHLLEKGPVVLYFYPKAFTPGCTLEAHAFAEATADFAKAGASVIGMSNDQGETLRKFSSEECRDKFPVASASPAIIKAYDVALGTSGLAKRTSYVIDRKGRIVLVHSDMDYRGHVELTLEAVRKLSARH
ncbi:alkyl hydroperoxide reductase/ Thiol specific antioxidant/ Mal allergen [Novosphingobium nitrogenifigens DSM 19370]|uniref:thioredoxin-dependent peroxiredoxin n=1 Tax=Novosphingobium nitrogenifigens DSM 19370 TaxID=983920 RepID=F1Z944_9SPHN|nr:peroxiredoxin [Novosphingobium nitrogenifigens]EGD58936.1 alkyl hydroperoxide reductase/ Thiol specific antioxidant/ Mal allergen [Novosphingobium nitrogenifigens DSM 19370]